MRFTVRGQNPEQFDRWVAHYNSRDPQTIVLGDPPRQYAIDRAKTRIGMHRAGDIVLYEILRPDGFPFELLGEIARAFPDLEFEGTHGEFKIKDRQFSWDNSANSTAETVEDMGGESDLGPDLPSPSS